MTELELYNRLCWGLMGLGVLTFVFALFFTAGYGRHGHTQGRFRCSNRLGWLIMETPAVFGMFAVLANGKHASQAPAWIFFTIWLVHYGYRTLVYPFRIAHVPRGMPLAIALTGCVFQSLNAYLNGRWISHLHDYDMSWFSDIRFIVGLLLFLVSLAGNLWSDEILLRLKRAAPDRYQIPRGGPYRWISSPNYLFEIMEWGGWALLTWSFAGAAFWLYTFANLAPRALAHHRWYHEKFPDYPPERKALIPGVL